MNSNSRKHLIEVISLLNGIVQNLDDETVSPFKKIRLENEVGLLEHYLKSDETVLEPK